MSMIELQRHSSIFGDTAVQFPKDDLNLIEAIFDEASVRPRNIIDRILRTYTFNPPTARAARIKIQVSYIEIIGIQRATIWARWRAQPVEIKATRVGFPPGDLGLIVCVLLVKQVMRV